MNDVKNITDKAKAFLGLTKEDESVKDLLDAADIVAQKEQEKKEANSDAADLIGADMVASVQYFKDMAMFKDFVADAVAFIEAQPTEEEINARIAAEVKTAHENLLKALKSKTQVPRATTQPLLEEEQANEYKLDSFNKRLDEIKSNHDKIYN